ncbi:hypothetical protein URH17368_2751 [Alicyclobacillus hesperidum URH17-3-68]|nr:hypothetical protein URH17368_2751 [Alicyclobacillus hesperidum URH17-3-68]
MSHGHSIEKELEKMKSVRMSKEQRDGIWENIVANLDSVPKRNMVPARSVWASVGGGAAAIALVVGGYAAVHKGSPGPRTAVEAPAQASSANGSPAILYQLNNYAAQANRATVPFYEDGHIVQERMPIQKSLEIAKAHSPWRTDPVLSAQAYTANLLPAGFAHAAWSTTSHHTLTTTKNGVIATYQLLSRNDAGSPPTANVQLYITGEGHPLYYHIHLFELQHRYVWDIARIVRTPAPPIPLPSGIKSLSVSTGLAAIGYVPNQFDKVARQITVWLETATRTSYQLPPAPANLIFNVNVAPDTLYLTASDGTQISITPAYTIVRRDEKYEVLTQPDTVEYRTSTEVAYLHCPALYKWLDDHAWKASFHLS